MSTRLRIALVAIVMALLAIAGGTILKGPLESLVGSFESLGVWKAPAIFLGVTIAVVFVLPSSPFTLGAGYFLGILLGSVSVLVGMTLGSAIAFLIARYVLRERVVRAAQTRPQLAALDEAVAVEGWKFVFLIRLIPFFPSKLANYVFGSARINFWPYFLASFLGYIPNTISSVYIGSLARDLTESRERTALQWVVWILGLVALLAISAKASRMAKKIYNARTNEPQ